MALKKYCTTPRPYVYMHIRGYGRTGCQQTWGRLGGTRRKLDVNFFGQDFHFRGKIFFVAQLTPRKNLNFWLTAFFEFKIWARFFVTGSTERYVGAGAALGLEFRFGRLKKFSKAMKREWFEKIPLAPRGIQILCTANGFCAKRSCAAAIAFRDLGPIWGCSSRVGPTFFLRKFFKIFKRSTTFFKSTKNR